MLVLRVQFACEVNQKISLATTVLTNAFAFFFSRAHRLEPELSSAKYFFNLIYVRLDVLLKQWVCMEHWI